MKLFRKTIAAAVAAVLFSTAAYGNLPGSLSGNSPSSLSGNSLGSAPEGADATEQQPDKSAPKKENLTAAAEGVDKIILVIGDESESLSGVTVSYYERNLGPGHEWGEIFSTPGLYGRNGGTYGKEEGDGKTPCGTYNFTMAFGIKDDPGSKIPYHKVTKNDYWVDDVASPYYNKFVSTDTVKKTWNSAEYLIAHKPEYNYALALNYNEAAIPGKGSAIFLHCNRDVVDAGSAGCIRIPEKYMIQLLQSVDETTRIVIVPDISFLEPPTLIPDQYGRYL